MYEILKNDSIFPNTELRVGFIGASSVGKTQTFLKVQKITGIDGIPEIIRMATQALGYADISSVVDKTLLQWTILRTQLSCEKQKLNFLSDRTTLDNYAYWDVYHWREGNGRVSRAEHDRYHQLAFENVKNYTHLIYFPIMWDEVNDGVRIYDPEGRKAIDQKVQALIDRWRMRSRTLTITKDDLKDGEWARTKEILEFLGLFPLLRAKELL